VTGFFGHATQSAVKRFQQKWNIEQTGFVGPLTRAAMKSACSGGSPTTTNTFSFSASPTSGSSPLAVTFTANQAETLSSDLSYVVDFGDGNRGTMSATSSGAFTLSHTYTTGGTFNPILYQERNFCGGVATYGCVADLAMASTSVTVNGGSNNPLTGGSCTTSEFLSGPGSKYGATSTPGFYVPATFANPGSNSITIEFMNYPGTGQSGTAASQSLVQGWGSPMTKTYPAGTVLYGDPDWWDGLPNTGVPPSVNCALDVQFDPCVIYQCVDGTWTTHQIVPARGVQPSF
jgi:peptidoglycan hydrolase-like protein with peptidoglycan-binding domain